VRILAQAPLFLESANGGFADEVGGGKVNVLLAGAKRRCAKRRAKVLGAVALPQLENN
jgi:hypothetical protein